MPGRSGGSRGASISGPRVGLLDTLAVRGFSGREPSVQGTIAALSGGENAPDQPTFFSFNGRFEAEPDNSPSLRIEDMRMGIRIPTYSSARQDGTPVTEIQYVNVGINTDVEIREGQQVVVGKSTVGDNALFLVMSAAFIN
jgi:hypothetical protein